MRRLSARSAPFPLFPSAILLEIDATLAVAKADLSDGGHVDRVVNWAVWQFHSRTGQLGANGVHVVHVDRELHAGSSTETRNHRGGGAAVSSTLTTRSAWLWLVPCGSAQGFSGILRVGTTRSWRHLATEPEAHFGGIHILAWPGVGPPSGR